MKPNDTTASAKKPPANAASDPLRERFALDVTGGYFDMLGAHHSADAVFGSAGGFSFGGDVAYLFGKRRRVSVTLGMRVFKKDGDRVFVADPGGAVFKLGHPLQMRLLPIQATLGYRFQQRRLLRVRFTPYAGAGFSLTSYSEKSTVGSLTESTSLTKAGIHALLGAETGRKEFRFGIEAGYSLVPSAIGVGGVSKVYGESDIGSFSLLGKLSFGSAKR